MFESNILLSLPMTPILYSRFHRKYFCLRKNIQRVNFLVAIQAWSACNKIPRKFPHLSDMKQAIERISRR